MKGLSVDTIKGPEDQSKLISRLQGALETSKGANREFLEMFLETLVKYKTSNGVSNNSEIKIKDKSPVNVKNIFSEQKKKSLHKSPSFSNHGFGFGFEDIQQKKSRFTVIPCNLDEDWTAYSYEQKICIPNVRRPKTEEEKFREKVRSSPWKLKYPFDKITQNMRHMSTIEESVE